MTDFRDIFMKASPVKQVAGDRAERLRKRAQRKSERSGETGGYNYSDPKVLKLLDKAKKIENKNFIKSTGAKKVQKEKDLYMVKTLGCLLHMKDLIWTLVL